GRARRLARGGAPGDLEGRGRVPASRPQLSPRAAVLDARRLGGGGGDGRAGGARHPGAAGGAAGRRPRGRARRAGVPAASAPPETQRLRLRDLPLGPDGPAEGSGYRARKPGEPALGEPARARLERARRLAGAVALLVRHLPLRAAIAAPRREL